MTLRARTLLTGVISLAGGVVLLWYAGGHLLVLNINQTYHPKAVGVLEHMAVVGPAAFGLIALVFGVILTISAWTSGR